MGPDDTPGRAGLCVYNAGFFKDARVRRILDLAGWDVTFGLPGDGDAVGIWGASPTSHRGRAVAKRADAPLVTVEDAFLRSVLPGRSGEPAMGLVIDRTGVHFDASAPSDLETLLATQDFDDALLARADRAIERIGHWALSKYNCWDPRLKAPEDDYVVVVDQTRGDASLPEDAEARFAQMLAAARDENPRARVLLRTHPETTLGHRTGFYGTEHCDDQVTLSTEAIAPARLLRNAQTIYTVSSTLGFEAILHGHAPRVFGTPFYAGWGLTRDQGPMPRRGRTLTPAQLFAGAMVLYPTWYDPFRDRLCQVEDVIDALTARMVAWQQDRAGWVITNMSAWKRPHLTKVFGGWARVDCRTRRADAQRLAQRTGRPLMVWANDAGPTTDPFVRIEDGFLRSPGLGAALVPPSSLGLDDEGIHFDPAKPSRLERLVSASVDLPLAEIERVDRLIARITALGVSKYNLKDDLPPLPETRPRVLVVGQVENDAAVQRARPDPFGNRDLLLAARDANPDATVIFKSHPDVEAGFRAGRVADAGDIADLVLTSGDAAKLLAEVDAVWTISSTMGLEALMRGVPVTCLGAPFYAGWGLTTDLGPVPDRRAPGPSLQGLIHAALIGYPRYFDPVTGQPCPVEVAVERLAEGIGFAPPGILARLQRLKAWVR
ncbi:MAG: capsular polysaccharide biosynthesis protein [Pseudomonadota bacterium]